MLQCLNDYSGLFAFLAVVVSIVIPFVIYKMQRKDEQIAELKRLIEDQRNVQDELDSFNAHSPFPMSEMERLKQSRISFLERRLSRKF